MSFLLNQLAISLDIPVSPWTLRTPLSLIHRGSDRPGQTCQALQELMERRSCE